LEKHINQWLQITTDYDTNIDITFKGGSIYLDGERPFDADLEREETDLERDLDAVRRALGDLLQSIMCESSTQLPKNNKLRLSTFGYGSCFYCSYDLGFYCGNGLVYHHTPSPIAKIWCTV
jgi:hypothetical protein